MIYLDNAATGGFKPDCVIEGVTAALLHPANPGRSGHKLSVACLERVYAARKVLCEFFGGENFERVIFTKNCTEGLNIAILGGYAAAKERGRPKIITTVAEHNSVLRPIEFLKREGAEVAYIPLDSRGEIDLIALERETKSAEGKEILAVMTLASNVTGISLDVAAIRKILPEGAILICDGAQACGHVPVDVGAGIDALAVAGHKGMLGVQGSGALILSERFSPYPILFGGTGSESYNLNMPDFYPDRLESGTLNYPAIISLAEGANYLKEHMGEHVKFMAQLMEEAHGLLGEIKGVKLYSRPNPFGIVAFGIDDMQSERAAYRLSEDYGICVRGGLHCAPKMHEALGSEGLIRASFSPFNKISAAKNLASAVAELIERG